MTLKLLSFVFSALIPVNSIQLYGAQPLKDTAVLILAHGGSSKWNQEVLKLKKELGEAGYRAEAAFGMADIKTIEKGLAQLESRKPKPKFVVCVPLMVSSNSELYDHFGYVLGLREKPSDVFLEAMAAMASASGAHPAGGARPKGGHSGNGTHSHHANDVDLRRVKSGLSLKFSAALDDHPYVSEILLARAKAISRDAGKETVVLISHGPYTDEVEAAWMASASKVALRIKELGGFADAQAFNLRDDSPGEIKEKNAKKIRAFVGQEYRRGRRIIVLGHLVAANGIEKHIKETLEGLFYKMSSQALLPHPLIARWILEKVQGFEGK